MLRLSDLEEQEIIRFLEADQPLPEKPEETDLQGTLFSLDDRGRQLKG